MNNDIKNIIYSKIKKSKEISTSKPDYSKSLSKEAYKISKDNDLLLEQGYSLIALAFSARAKSEIKDMLNYSFQALDIFEEKDEIDGKIKAMNLIGISYFYSSMYEKSLEYLLNVIDLLELGKDDFLLSCVLNNIGEVYRESKEFEKALPFYHKAEEISRKNNYEIINASVLGNIGDIYFSQGKFEKSLEILMDSYKILIKSNDMVSLGETENRIGKVYFNLNDENNANKFYYLALNRLENIENKYYLIDVYINIAKLKKHEDKDEALYYYNKSLKYSEEIDAKKKSCEIYKLMSTLYEEKEDFKTALDYYKRHSNIEKEIMASNLGNKLEILNIEIKNSKGSYKYREIRKRLEKEIELQKNEIQKIRQTNEKLFNKAYQDELTGIPNRRSINSYIKKLIREKREREEIIGVLMIDIDHFKRYNDCWGHTQGDDCLKQIAYAVNNIQRKNENIFARYGGEEFIYFLRNTDEENITLLGNKIRKAVEDLKLNYTHQEKEYMLTVSLGGAYGKISNISSFADLMERADKKLYEAKDKGRNKLIIKNMM
jgi:diguanylate cyclase (GGDEF)-like protein